MVRVGGWALHGKLHGFFGWALPLQVGLEQKKKYMSQVIFDGLAAYCFQNYRTGNSEYSETGAENECYD